MSSPRPELLVAPCSYQAAKYAVEHWHYSGRMPTGKAVKVGAWEEGQFIGAIVFSWGSNRHIGSEFGLTMFEACELVRVALGKHITPTSKVMARSIKLLRHSSPNLRLIVSLADPYQNHTGILYQAGNWIYTGYASSDRRVQRYEKNGVIKHWRTIAQELHNRGLRSTVEDSILLGYRPLGHIPKHRYLYPLDDAMRRQIAPLAQPYPKKDTRPVNGDDLATSEIGRFDSEPGALIEADDGN